MNDQNDTYLWLEEVESKKALKWAETWNNKTFKAFKSEPIYQKILQKNIQILNSPDRIASPSICGDYIYNFWQDSVHVRGIWRRIPFETYIRQDESPLKVSDWETLLNLDKLSEQDNIKWVFKGAQGLAPLYNRFMVSLSRGGGDAVVVREFDVASKKFVPRTEEGFHLSESKGTVAWVDEDALDNDFSNSQQIVLPGER